MENIMFQTALNHYRKQELLEECVLKEESSYLFSDIDDGYSFVVNDVSKIEPIEYFLRRTDVSYENLAKQDYSKFLDIDKLNNVLKKIDPLLFFNLNEVLIIFNEEEIGLYEEYIGGELLEDTLGQSCVFTKQIIINFHQLLEDVLDISFDKDNYFQTVVYQFYITLIHEMGHNSLNYGLLNYSYSPLSKFINNFDDEEELVEGYAELIFAYLENTTDVFGVFNKDEILKYYNE